MPRGVTRTVPTPQPPRLAGSPAIAPDERLTDGDDVGLPEELLEPAPVFVVGESEDVASHGLIDIDPQRRVERPRDLRNLGQPVEIRFHHHGNDRYADPEPAASRRLLVDEIPVAGAPLCVLLLAMGIIEREFDVGEAAQLLVVEHRDRMAVGRMVNFSGLLFSRVSISAKSGCMPFSPVPRFTERIGTLSSTART